MLPPDLKNLVAETSGDTADIVNSTADQLQTHTGADANTCLQIASGIVGQMLNFYAQGVLTLPDPAAPSTDAEAPGS